MSSAEKNISKCPCQKKKILKCCLLKFLPKVLSIIAKTATHLENYVRRKQLEDFK